jgi:hypothetical protein
MKKLVLLSVSIFCLITSCDQFYYSLKSNAEIISFNSLKCGCCWGWTIKIGNDTIKSADVIIEETVGFEINKPIKVYIELGEIEDTCSNSGISNPDYRRDYYEIKKIVKIK